MDEKDYTTEQAAEILGMKPQSVTRNILRENIKAEKRGRDYFILASELERFKNQRRRVGRPSSKSVS